MGNEAFNVSGNLLQRLWSKVRNLENIPPYEPPYEPPYDPPFELISYQLSSASGTITSDLRIDTSNGAFSITFTNVGTGAYNVNIVGNPVTISAITVTSARKVFPSLATPLNVLCYRGNIFPANFEMFVLDPITQTGQSTWQDLSLTLYVK